LRTRFENQLSKTCFRELAFENHFCSSITISIYSRLCILSVLLVYFIVQLPTDVRQFVLWGLTQQLQILNSIIRVLQLKVFVAMKRPVKPLLKHRNLLVVMFINNAPRPCFAPASPGPASPLLHPCFALASPLVRPCFAPGSPLLRPCFAPASPLLRPCFAPASPLLRPALQTSKKKPQDRGLIFLSELPCIP
jgi:hypothetical protein